MKKAWSVILTFVLAFTLFVPAYAAENDSISEAKQLFNGTLVQKLNQVAKAPVKKVQNSISNGNTIKTEIRELKISDKLSIVNTRTYTIPNSKLNSARNLKSGSMQTVTDKYGFQFAGMPDALGYIVASYKYKYVDIDSPNHMKTLIYSASGYGKGLDEDYVKIESTDPTWDTDASYDASASVVFNLKMRDTPKVGIWFSATMTNNCSFDSYGTPSTNWS